MTFDAPLWTTEDKPTICPRCNANREALFALAMDEGVGEEWKGMDAPALAAMIRSCPLCWEAWKEAKRA